MDLPGLGKIVFLRGYSQTPQGAALFAAGLTNRFTREGTNYVLDRIQPNDSDRYLQFEKDLAANPDEGFSNTESSLVAFEGYKILSYDPSLTTLWLYAYMKVEVVEFPIDVTWVDGGWKYLVTDLEPRVLGSFPFDMIEW